MLRQIHRMESVPFERCVCKTWLGMTILTFVRKSAALLSSRDRKVLVANATLQALTSILDLLGVALIASLTILGAQKLQIQSTSNAKGGVQRILFSVGSHFSSDGAFLSTLAISAIVFFLFKSLVSLFLLRRIYRFLARRSAEISSRLASDFFQNSLLFVQNRPKPRIRICSLYRS